MTIQAVENFNLDLIFFESFVRKLSEPNSSLTYAGNDLNQGAGPEFSPSMKSSVYDTLLKVRQVLDLIRSSDPEEFLDSKIREKKYSTIVTEDILRLFERLVGNQTITSFRCVLICFGWIGWRVNFSRQVLSSPLLIPIPTSLRTLYLISLKLTFDHP